MNWIDKTKAMGVTQETIEHFGIDEASDGHGVVYPCQYSPRIDYETNQIIYHVTYRQKRFPDDLKKNPRLAKYKSEPTENLPGEELPAFYTPDYAALRGFITQNDGGAYAVEGEKDTWAMFGAGIRNTFGFMGTGGIPQNIVEELTNLGVTHLTYIVDNDAGGWDAAERLQDMLYEKIGLVIKQLPPVFDGNVIKDPADLWLALSLDPAVFRQIIHNLKPMELPNRAQREQSQDKGGYFQDEFYAEIERLLGVQGYQNSGWSNPVKCIFKDHENDDHKPAAAWHRDMKIFRCFKCGTTWFARDVARALNIDYVPFVKDIHATPPPARNKDDGVGTGQQTHDGAQFRIARSLLEMNAVTDYDAVPPGEFMYSLDQGLDNLTARMQGAITSKYPPIAFPFKSFHKFGGLCQALSRPLMVGVVGQSGGLKTTFLTSFITALSLQGYHSIVWSPEWSPEKNADRVIQQLGGISMTDQTLLERWHYEQAAIQRGDLSSDDPVLFGVQPHEERLEETLRLIQSSRTMLKGKIIYINQFGANILEVLSMVRAAYKRMTTWGYPPSVLVMDYAQMALAPQGWGSEWDKANTIWYTKGLTLDLGLLSIVASQVTKEATKNTQSGKSSLDKTSGLYVRDDAFNLYLGLEPLEEHFTDDSSDEPIIYKILRVYILKNSLGSLKIKGNIGWVDMLTNEARLAVSDWNVSDNRSHMKEDICEDDYDIDDKEAYA